MKRAPWYVPLGVLALLISAGAWWWTSRQAQRETHSVTLTWNAPPHRPEVVLAGYSVYRRTADGGDFVKIAERVAGPPYEDHLVSSGRKYIYVVTAVDETGRESRFSSEVSAEIP